MKTWEKVYWGIIGVLFVLSLSPLLTSPAEGVIITVNGQVRIISRLAYFGYLLLGYLIIWGLIWLVVRLIINKGWSEKGERERERTSLELEK